MVERLGRGFWIVVLISTIVMFFNLGSIPLLDPDEPVYAETAKEMLQFNDLVSPRIYGAYWYDKPPMYYWLVTGAFQLFGINEFAARFPSALLAVGCVVMLYFFARSVWNERAAVAGALILSTSIEFFYMGKAAVTDITLTFFLTASLFAFWKKQYYLFYILAGLATVTKGPIGLLFPAGIIFLYMLATRNFKQVLEMKIPIGIILYSIVAIPWYWAMYSIHGNAFIETFLGFHNITRFTSPEHPEGVLWYYYIPVLIIGFFPWTAILGQAVWSSLTKSNGQSYLLLIFLNIWAFFIFIFFTISQTKLVSYILPLYPPLAMIAGWYLDRAWNYRYTIRYRSWAVVLGVLAAIFTVGLVAGLKSMPSLAQGIYYIIAVFAVMTGLVVLWVWRRRLERAFWTQIICMIVFVMILMSVIFPIAAPKFTSLYIAQDFKQHYDGVSDVYIIKFLHPGFSFYSGVYGKEIKSDNELSRAIQDNSQAYYVIRQSEYKRLSAERVQAVTVLAVQDNTMLLRRK